MTPFPTNGGLHVHRALLPSIVQSALAPQGLGTQGSGAGVGVVTSGVVGGTTSYGLEDNVHPIQSGIYW